jgi:hypothetical protein
MARMKEVRRIEMWWGGVKWPVWRMARMTAIEWALVLPLTPLLPSPLPSLLQLLLLLPLVPQNLKASVTVLGISLEKS